MWLGKMAPGWVPKSVIPSCFKVCARDPYQGAELHWVPRDLRVPNACRGPCSWFGSVNLIPQDFSYLKPVLDLSHVQRR